MNGTYHVCASASDDPPCINPKGCVILESGDIANGPGHHGYICIPGTDEWRIVYHRRIIGDLERRHRMLCMLTVSARDDAENLYLAIKMLHSTMGHADIETILDRYTHAQEERLCAVGQLLDGKFKSSDSCHEA